MKKREKETETPMKHEKFTYKKGDEIGHFKYGSTVICLWKKDSGNIAPEFVPGKPVLLGQAMINEN